MGTTQDESKTSLNFAVKDTKEMSETIKAKTQNSDSALTPLKEKSKLHQGGSFRTSPSRQRG